MFFTSSIVAVPSAVSEVAGSFVVVPATVIGITVPVGTVPEPRLPRFSGGRSTSPPGAGDVGSPFASVRYGVQCGAMPVAPAACALAAATITTAPLATTTAAAARAPRVQPEPNIPASPDAGLPD